MDDPYNLQRFVDAQQHVFASVIAELRQGSKRGHWMWFVFPQLKGLGRTAQSNFFGISSVQEAAAYLQHPVLGPRLIECTQLVNAIDGRSAEDIFGECRPPHVSQLHVESGHKANAGYSIFTS